MPSRSNAKKMAGWTFGAAGLLAMALLMLATPVVVGLGYGAVPLLMGAVAAVLPVPIYVALVMQVDRYEKEPARTLAWAFLWGAGVATFLSAAFRIPVGLLAVEALGRGPGEFVGSVLLAPLAEEALKGLALLLLYLWKKDEFDGVIDGIVYAGMVGLGFAMTENLAYFTSFWQEGGASVYVAQFVFRSMLEPFAHPAFTAMVGIGLGLALRSTSRRRRVLLPTGGLLLAMLLHALSNLLTTSLERYAGPALLADVILVGILLPVGVLVVVVRELKREGRIIKEHLSPELESGVLSAEDHDALGSVRGRLRASYRAMRSGGRRGWQARGRFHQAATKLAFLRERAERGIPPEGDAEAAYLLTLSQPNPSGGPEAREAEGADA